MDQSEVKKEGEIKSGDFLEDLDIIITLRSSKVKVSDLTKIMQALTANTSSSLDCTLELIEAKTNFTQTFGKNLVIITHHLQTQEKTKEKTPFYLK